MPGDFTNNTNALPADVREAIVEVIRSELRAALQAKSPGGAQFFTVKQTLEILGLSRTDLYRRARAGDLTIIKRGRRTLLAAEEVQGFADRLRATAASKPAGGGAAP
jgi:hypothetical protein